MADHRPGSDWLVWRFPMRGGLKCALPAEAAIAAL